MGSTSAGQTCTVSNTGNATLTIASVTASGEFAQSNNCAGSVAAGSKCTVQVTFTPTATGTRSGAISIADNATGSPHSVTLTGTGASATAGSVTYYVAPNGKDTWSGTLAAPNGNNTDGPLATFDRARAVVQANKAGFSQVTVQFRAGTYELPAAVQFTAADSGSAATQITYQNYPGEMAVISGGKALTGWTQSTTVPGAWRVSVAGMQPFEQLWVNGQRRYRARWNVTSASGYLNNLGPIYVANSTGCTNANYAAGYSPALLITSGARSGQYECFDRFFFRTGDINPNWSGVSDANHPIEVIVFEDWTVARMRLASIGPSSIYAGAPANSSVAYLVGAMSVGQFWGVLPGHRYLIDNVKEALSSSTPGQWIVDTDTSGNPSVLTYVPAAGEDFSGNPPTVMVPQISQLLVANNLSYVSFKGLTFSHANWVAGTPGYTTFAAGENAPNDTVPAALSFTKSSHIVLDSVAVANTGGWGADIVGTNANFTTPASACSSQSLQNCNNQVVNSEFTDLGSGAIRLGDNPVASDTDANVAAFDLIYNNVLAGGDRMLPGTALWIGDAHDNVIDHNDLYDFYNTAINLGHSLNFDANNLPNWTHDNLISYNHVYQIGQGVTDDIGAVHAATGLQTGNQLLHNTFHDITHDPGTGGYGGWGIYLDQGSSFVTAKNNLVYNTSATGFTYNHSESGTFQLKGTPNPIQNNIFAFGAEASIHRNLDDGGMNLTFQNNIVYWDQTAPPFGPPSPQMGMWVCNGSTSALTGCFSFASNLYYSKIDPGMATWRFIVGSSNPMALTLAMWQGLGEDAGSATTVDPLFVCPAKTACSGSGAFNFNLQSNSPAPALIHFVPFDPTQAGRANPVLMPPALPPAFPLQVPASY